MPLLLPPISCREKQPCPHSSVLLARVRERQAKAAALVAPPPTSATAEPAPEHFPPPPDDVARASDTVQRVVSLLRRGGLTSAAIFSKLQAAGRLQTKKQFIEVREALQAVAHCDNSVWTLKEAWQGPAPASRKRRR